MAGLAPGLFAFRTDDNCAATYDLSFAGAARRIDQATVHLIGLGCGGGQKDTRLLRLLKESGKSVSYTPSDVSSAMVLVAREAALTVIPAEECHPLFVIWLRQLIWRKRLTSRVKQRTRD